MKLIDITNFFSAPFFVGYLTRSIKDAKEVMFENVSLSRISNQEIFDTVL